MIFDDENVKSGTELNHSQLIFMTIYECVRTMVDKSPKFPISVDALDILLPYKDSKYLAEMERLERDFPIKADSKNPYAVKKLNRMHDFNKAKLKFQILMMFIDRKGFLPMKKAVGYI